MKSNRKRILAILTAGLLVASSSAVYAAQLPQEAPSLVSSSSSSNSYNLGGNVTAGNYTLTSNKFSAEFFGTVFGTDVQFRIKIIDYKVEMETGTGTNEFTTIDSGTVQDYNAYRVSTDCNVSLKPGQRIRVTVRISAPAFHGYQYVGDAGATEVFYYNL